MMQEFIDGERFWNVEREMAVRSMQSAMGWICFRRYDRFSPSYTTNYRRSPMKLKG